MNLRYWFFWFKIVPWKVKLKFFGCFFGFHDLVYGIHGFNRYHLDCSKCNKRVVDGIDV